MGAQVADVRTHRAWRQGMPSHWPIRCHVYQSPFSLAASLHFTFRETREFSLSFPTYWQTSFGQHTDDFFFPFRVTVCDAASTSAMCDDTREKPGSSERSYNE